MVRYLGLVIVGSIALLQINKKLSSFPNPVASGTLITNGAFFVARHPINTGLISSGLGYTLDRESLYKILIVLLLGILFYLNSACFRENFENTNNTKIKHEDFYEKLSRRILERTLR